MAETYFCVLLFYSLVQAAFNHYDDCRGVAPWWGSALWPVAIVWDGLKALKELNNMEETV